MQKNDSAGGFWKQSVNPITNQYNYFGTFSMLKIMQHRTACEAEASNRLVPELCMALCYNTGTNPGDSFERTRNFKKSFHFIHFFMWNVCCLSGTWANSKVFLRNFRKIFPRDSTCYHRNSRPPLFQNENSSGRCLYLFSHGCFAHPLCCLFKLI